MGTRRRAPSRSTTVARAYRLVRRASVTLLVVVAVALPHQLQAHQVDQVSAALVLSAAVLGLGLLVGLTGQVSLGHGAFFGLGAYTTAVLVYNHSWPYPATVVVAAALCFVVGYAVGVPAGRLVGPYLGILTIGLAAAFPVMIRRYESITRGNRAIRIDGFAPPGWLDLEHDQWTYYLILGTVLGLFLLAWNLMRGRIGRAMVSLRDDPLAAQASGVDVARVKSVTFGLSATYAGIAGALNTFLVGAVSPDSFTVTKSVEFLAVLVIGGLGSITGPFLGGFGMQFLPRHTASINPNLPGVVYGGTLIALMYLAPGGVASAGRRVRDLALRRLRVVATSAVSAEPTRDADVRRQEEGRRPPQPGSSLDRSQLSRRGNAR